MLGHKGKVIKRLRVSGAPCQLEMSLPGGCNSICSRVAFSGRPTTALMNGFHAGYDANSVSADHTQPAEA